MRYMSTSTQLSVDTFSLKSSITRLSLPKFLFTLNCVSTFLLNRMEQKQLFPAICLANEMLSCFGYFLGDCSSGLVLYGFLFKNESHFIVFSCFVLFFNANVKSMFSSRPDLFRHPIQNWIRFQCEPTQTRVFLPAVWPDNLLHFHHSRCSTFCVCVRVCVFNAMLF